MIFKATMLLVLMSRQADAASAAGPTPWCDGSPVQRCRMRCPDPPKHSGGKVVRACGEGECKMRQGTCCDYTCQKTESGSTGGIRRPYLPAYPDVKRSLLQRSGQYFLVDTPGFNCKNQALNYITDEDECIKAAISLGVSKTKSPLSGGGTQEYCGIFTFGGVSELSFNSKDEDGALEKATDTQFQICKEKESPWEDEDCGRELCVPDVFKTDDPKKFDLSMVEWSWGTGGDFYGSFWPGGAFHGYIPGQPWKEGVALYNMTTKYLPHFHKHTYFHSGWILYGQKSTFELDGDENDPQWIKPTGTYFALEEGIWHTEKLESPWCIIYLRFVEMSDYIWPNVESNRKYIVEKETRVAPKPPSYVSLPSGERALADDCVETNMRWKGKHSVVSVESIFDCFLACQDAKGSGGHTGRKCSRYAYVETATGKECKLFHGKRELSAMSGWMAAKRKCHPTEGVKLIYK